MEIYILFAVVVMVAVTISVFSKKSTQNRAEPEAKFEYVYTRKRYMMTKAESDFYGVLQRVIGANYMICPQAHLDLFLDHQVKGQSWKGALAKIQRKSVDFLICSREYYTPLVAIELDDVSHTQDERMERDDFVDGICKAAGMPIVHILSNGSYDAEELLQKITPYLK